MSGAFCKNGFAVLRRSDFQTTRSSKRNGNDKRRIKEGKKERKKQEKKTKEKVAQRVRDEKRSS